MKLETAQVCVLNLHMLTFLVVGRYPIGASLDHHVGCSARILVARSAAIKYSVLLVWRAGKEFAETGR
jgi:hypothetical protein